MKALLLALLLPPAAAAQPPVAVLEGHNDHVFRVLFSSDSRRVISASEDGTVKVWGAADGNEILTYRSTEIIAGLFAIDGIKVAVNLNDHGVRIRDLFSGEETAALRGLPDELRTLAISQDGRLAATIVFNGPLQLWAEGRPVVLRRTEDAHAFAMGQTVPGQEPCLAFSLDGSGLLAGLGDETLHFFNTASAQQIASWRGHRNQVMAAVFSPDGRTALSGGSDNTIRRWDVATGETLAVWRGHTSHIYSLAFSPDGKKALSGSADHTVRLWDAASGKELRVGWGHQGIVRHVAFSPDGKLAASAGEDRAVMLWSMDGSRRAAPAQSPTAPEIGSREDLGRHLFFDRRLSGDSTLNCADCHDPRKHYTDGLALSTGYQDTLYFRNTPSLLNLAGQKHLYWDGRFPSTDLPSLIRDHIAEAHFMNADGRLIVEKLRQAPGYVDVFRKIYGDEPSYSRILDALTSFVLSLKSADPGELSAAARRGQQLFAGKGGCSACHNGPLLSDGKMHDRGVPDNPEIFHDPLRRISLRRFFKLLGVKDYASLRRDPGLYAISKNQADAGKFRTPSLREIGRTAPYMHNGMFATLEEAVHFENPELAEPERRDIVAFLESLGSELPAASMTPPRLPRYAVRPAGPHPAPPSTAPPAARPKAPPLGPLPPVPVPKDNPLTAEKVELGKLLFHDPRLSGDGYTFCATCHAPAMGWGDGSDLAQGYPGTLHWRNSQTLLNAAYYSKLEWDGAWPSLEEQARGAITSNINGNADPTMIEERLAESPEYVELFKKAFGVERPNFESVLKALASFQRAVPISRHVPFDQGTLSPAARRGRRLFENKAGCIACHNGPLASDQGFHATGVPRHPAFEHIALRQITLRYQHVTRGVPEEVYRDADTDQGLYLSTLRKEDIGRFRTPSLRELKYTAPYMHNGIFQTLAEVVDFYNEGGGETPNKSPQLKPLALTAAEKDDLIAFLEALSGDEILLAPPPAEDGR
ncbi:MAG: cytochrome c peroxidase [Elusimicrobiota bacterium]